MKKILFIFAYAFYTKNIHLISEYIKASLSRKKTHKKIIYSINRVLEAYFKLFSNILGYRLQIKGRINGIKRKKKLVFQKGKIPLNSLKHEIKYNFNEFKTPSGICSIKFWVFFKKKKKKTYKVIRLPQQIFRFQKKKNIKYQEIPPEENILYPRYKQKEYIQQIKKKRKEIKLQKRKEEEKKRILKKEKNIINIKKKEKYVISSKNKV